MAPRGLENPRAALAWGDVFRKKGSPTTRRRRRHSAVILRRRNERLAGRDAAVSRKPSSLTNRDLEQHRFDRGRIVTDRCDIHRVPSAEVDGVEVNLNDRRVARIELSPREVTAEHIVHAFRAW